MQSSQDPKEENKTTLKRELGLGSLVGLGVGGIIGSGIFGLIAVYGADAGPSLTLAIVFVGIIMTILALIYAELGSRFPLTGGPYSIPRLALGNSAGYLVGWGYFIYAFTGTAAIIDVFVTYLGFYVPGLAVGGRGLCRRRVLLGNNAGDRAGGEGAGGNGLFQDAESVAKPIVLRDEIPHQEGKSRFSIGQRQLQGCFVN